MPRSKEETLRLMDPYLPAISRGIVLGARAAFDYDAQRMHKLRKITRRNIIRDEIADQLRTELHGVTGVRIDDHDQTTHFRFLGIFSTKIKKADECGDVELAKTQTSFQFQCNADMPGLDLEEAENLYLSYIDTGDPRMPTAVIISPSADGINWMQELPPPAFETVEITPLPVPPDADDDLVRITALPEEEQENRE